MTEGLARLNALPPVRAEEELRRVCGSSSWAGRVAARRPFADRNALEAAAEEAWDAMGLEDWREAIAAHPRIGEDKTAAGAAAGAWSRREQSGMDAAPDDTRAALALAQRRYEERFGHGFLICATGRGADAMLAECRARLDNEPDVELRVAAEEERKIGRLRIAKLMAEGGDA